MQYVHPIADKIIVLEHGKLIKEVQRGEIILDESNTFLLKGSTAK